MKTRLLLIAEPGLPRAAYLGVLRDLDVEVDCIASPGEMAGALMDAPYNGLVIDVPTMIRCDCGDKNRITRVMERFPVLRVMYNPKCGGIRGLAQGGTLRDNRDLIEFVEHECVPFSPRSIRVVQRREVVFNVVLLNRLGLPEVQGERTVTLNVSEHGCFIYSINDWRMGEPAWLVVNEFDDRTPIELKVRWQRPWGTASLLPGIGATFESMSTYQYVQLHSFL
ncbi:MAG: PilZ domain-containing protein [Pseudodesulfovibrio sp.]